VFNFLEMKVTYENLATERVGFNIGRIHITLAVFREREREREREKRGARMLLELEIRILKVWSAKASLFNRTTSIISEGQAVSWLALGFV